MDAQTLEGMINNPAISDDAVFEAVKEFLQDTHDQTGSLIIPSDDEVANTEKLSILMDAKRPGVQRRLREFYLDLLDNDCCGSDTSCKDS